MRKRLPLVRGCVVLFAVALLSGCGRNNSGAVSGAQAQAAPVDNEFKNTGFMTTRDLHLHPVQVTQESGAAVSAGNELVLSEGTELAILDSKQTAEGRLLRVGLDVEDGSQIPSDFWVKAEEIETDLIPYAPEDNENGIEATSESSIFGVRGKGGMTYCYRYVKEYLLQAGLVPVYLPGSSAWQAASILPRYGFHNTGTGPAGARDNDVCVYSGGRGGNGHIEVMRSGKWWYGYGFIDHPISLVNHRLIGCFRK
jgi:hypothetical protein